MIYWVSTHYSFLKVHMIKSKKQGKFTAQGSFNQMQQDGGIIQLILVIGMIGTGMAIAIGMANIFSIAIIWSLLITALVLGLLLASIFKRH